MRNIFIGFTPLNEEEINACWSEGLLFLDTNVLINLHQYKPKTNKTLFKAFSLFRNRVWINHFVGLEFFRNRPRIVREQSSHFEKVRNLIEQMSSNLDKQINEKDLEDFHTMIGISEFMSDFNNVKSSYLEKLKNLKNEHNYPEIFDNLLNDIQEIIGDNVTKEFTEDDVKKCDEDAKVRFENKIPPGFRDIDKSKDPESSFFYNEIEYKRENGDYYNWVQIINQAKESNLPVIFITDDNKDDWWWFHKKKGDKIGSRPELIQEFKQKTEQDIIIYDTKRFTQLALEMSGGEPEQDVLDDIAHVNKLRQIRRNVINHGFNNQKTFDGFDNFHDNHEQFNVVIHNWLNEIFHLHFGEKNSFVDYSAFDLNRDKTVGINIHYLDKGNRDSILKKIISAFGDKSDWRQGYDYTIEIFATESTRIFTDISRRIRYQEEKYVLGNRKISIALVLFNADADLDEDNNGIIEIDSFGYSP